MTSVPTVALANCVALIERGEHRAAADAIVAGHADYPSFRHLFPDASRRARALRAFFDATVGDGIANGLVLTIRHGRRVDATAVWLPPGAFPWSAWRKLRAVPAFVRVLMADPRSFIRFARLGSAIEHAHRDERSWYLVVLSVRPDCQRRGLGTRLIEPVLTRADQDGIPCRLETADPANVAYYRRFGFNVVDPPLDAVRGGPPLIRMHRPLGTSHGGR